MIFITSNSIKIYNVGRKARAVEFHVIYSFTSKPIQWIT
jgi:hypothetical protein